jgi:N-acetylmuramoyl-L-alanine amidase
MSRFKWILDAGHGGMKNGVYSTFPGKMFAFPDGFTIYEGVNNRAICAKLMKLLDEACIDYALTYDDVIDTPLEVRVSIADRLHKKTGNCIFVSVHSDALGDGNHGKGSGFSIFTSVGQTPSDKVAEIFCQVYEKNFPEFKFRKDKLDGDSDKEENFYVLRKTDCPAILIENLFFDNRIEADFISSEAGQDRIARAIFESIKLTEELKPI